jgi:uncharacterized membrane protein YjjB (DUF3815 family)
MTDLVFLILQDMFWSALAALGFAILFNVPRKALLYCMIGGAIGHALRTILVLNLGIAIEVGTLIGATFVGFWAKWCAVRLKTPSMIFAVSAVIPMVPGVFAYQTMIAILQITTVPGDTVSQILTDAVVNGVRTTLILAAIAVGIVSPTLLFQREKPVV